MVYIPDRTDLSIAANELTKVKDNALSIHPSYQDALNKFEFLSNMLESMKIPYSLFLVIFTFSVLFIQIGTLIGHRRHRYGIFLAKGMKWFHIYFILWFQIILAEVMGLFLSIIALIGARWCLESEIEPVALNYKDTVSLADFNLLPFPIENYLITFLIILIIACLAASVILLLMPVRPQTQPAILLTE